MADSKDFIAGVDSNAKKSPRRIVFITRRTSAQVKAETEDQVQTFPEVLFRAAVAVMLLAIALVWIALIFNAPLEGLADPSHTPNPAKAPWYFLGLQEMLHYFPPVVAGVLVPGLVVMALIVIPYFRVNIEAGAEPYSGGVRHDDHQVGRGRDRVEDRSLMRRRLTEDSVGNNNRRDAETINELNYLVAVRASEQAVLMLNHDHVAPVQELRAGTDRGGRAIDQLADDALGGRRRRV